MIILFNIKHEVRTTNTTPSHKNNARLWQYSGTNCGSTSHYHCTLSLNRKTGWSLSMKACLSVTLRIAVRRTNRRKPPASNARKVFERRLAPCHSPLRTVRTATRSNKFRLYILNGLLSTRYPTSLAKHSKHTQTKTTYSQNQQTNKQKGLL